ncbi:MAG TPA: hypothetical protein VFH27_16495 [Longimicrobiaceae bacterium]|nr:hypothetical protein [Longimicrobiaceae bacterium]
MPADYPICCNGPMRALAKGWAEAVMHLDAAERVRWLALGARIVRRPGRRWRAALTPRDLELAAEQEARHRGADTDAG